ncbi:MAG: alpha/beta hydrolase [Phycisphaeraceae bacterium]|nr:MAG: alpha/beta hydrolase [Phycisphaeraceae bacterium]
MLIGLIPVLVLGLALVVAGVWLWTWRMLRRPPRRTYAWAVSRGLPGDPGEMCPPRTFNAWSCRRGSADLSVWDVRGDDPSGPVVVISHGWGDSKVVALLRLPAAARHASRVVLWDMPGHGTSGGRSALGTAEPDDLLALLDQLAADRPIILMGWSLGAGVSIAAAAKAAARPNSPSPRIAGVIAEAPYRTARGVATNVLLARNLPTRWNAPVVFVGLGICLGVGPAWRGFDRALLAASLPCPLLVIHGDADTVCDLDDGRRIAAAAPNARLVMIEGAGHNDLWTDPAFRERCEHETSAFIAAAATPTPAPPHPVPHPSA